MNRYDPALAVIDFVLNGECEDGFAFMRYWYEGDFDTIRREWPEAPDTVFIGADPLHPDTEIC